MPARTPGDMSIEYDLYCHINKNSENHALATVCGILFIIQKFFNRVHPIGLSARSSVGCSVGDVEWVVFASQPLPNGLCLFQPNSAFRVISSTKRTHSFQDDRLNWFTFDTPPARHSSFSLYVPSFTFFRLFSFRKCWMRVNADSRIRKIQGRSDLNGSTMEKIDLFLFFTEPSWTTHSHAHARRWK